MAYVFDTSGLIGAWMRSYPPDSFPRLWDEMDRLIDAGRAFAPQEVYEELSAQDDDLLKWVKDRKEAFVVPTNRAVMLEARAILGAHKNLTKTGTGRNRADPFVIALASVKSLPVVTGEQGGTDAKPKIPSVCDAWGSGA